MGKKKKDKIVYVDDGRTLADMSGVNAGMRLNSANRPRPRARDVWNTYWNAVKMMFFPMLAVMGALVVIYVIMAIIFGLAA